MPRGPNRASCANSGNGWPAARSMIRPAAMIPPEQ